MTANKNKLFSVNTLLLCLYCCILVFACTYSHKKPNYNWDMLPYMVVMLYYDHTDFNAAHDKAYTIIKEQVPEKEYKLLTDTTHAYKKRVMESADALRQQIPYYVVKPLYTGMCYLFYKAGVSLTQATIWPSTICYFFIGLLVFFWLQKYFSTGFSFAVSLTIMFSGPVFSIAFLSTPDALSGLMLLLAVFFLVEKKSVTTSFIFLLLAVASRIDNAIPAIFILTAVRFSNNQDIPFNTKKFVMLSVIICFTYLLITLNATFFGWSLLFYTNVAKQLNPGNIVHSSFVLQEYIGLVKAQFMFGLGFSSISMFVFLTILLCWGKPLFNFNRLTIEQALAVMFIMAIIIRFILEPHIVERIYVPYYVSILIFVSKKYSPAENKLKLLYQ